MSPQNIQIVNDQIAQWRSTIAGYMKSYFPLNDFVKAVARVDAGNNLLPGTLTFYSEDPAGRYLPADTYFRVPTDEEVEQSSYDGIRMLVEH